MIRIGRVVLDESQVAKVVMDSEAKETTLYNASGAELASFNKYYKEAFAYFSDDATDVVDGD